MDDRRRAAVPPLVVAVNLAGTVRRDPTVHPGVARRPCPGHTSAQLVRCSYCERGVEVLLSDLKGVAWQRGRCAIAISTSGVTSYRDSAARSCVAVSCRAEPGGLR